MSKGRYFCGGSALAVTLALSFGGIAAAQDDATVAFTAADANGDLKLSQEEVAKLDAKFRDNAVDRDGDGVVTLQEYLDKAQSSGNVATVSAVTSVGSLVRGTPKDIALPVEILGREQAANRGNPSAAETIRDLSEVGNVQTQAARGFNASGVGVMSINLRNLGSGRTLLTINGRRLGDDPNTSNGGTSVTGGANQNASNVPFEVLEQTEILKGGGGATYGSDAVGGVVNFVPRRDVDGFEVTTSYQWIDGSDGNYDANVKWGKRRRDGQGDILLSFYYRNESPIPMNAIDYINNVPENFYLSGLTVNDYSILLGSYYFLPQQVGSTAEVARAASLGTNIAIRPGTGFSLISGGATTTIAGSGYSLLQGNIGVNNVPSNSGGLLRDDACLRLGGYRAFSTTPSPVCDYLRSDRDYFNDNTRTYRVFGQANFNLTDAFKYHTEDTFSKRVDRTDSREESVNAPCDPLPTAAPSGINGSRACTSFAQNATNGYSLPGYNPAVRDYVLKYYNQNNTTRVFTDDQIRSLTGMAVNSACTPTYVAASAASDVCFNGSQANYTGSTSSGFDPDGTGPLTANSLLAVGTGAGTAQGYVPTDGSGAIRYGRVYLGTTTWTPFVAMNNPEFGRETNQFFTDNIQYRSVQELTGDLGHLFGNSVDFRAAVTFEHDVTVSRANSLLTDRLQRALNGYGTDLDNFGADGCTAAETRGARTYTVAAFALEAAGTGQTRLADPDAASPYFGQTVIRGATVVSAGPNSVAVDPDGTGPLLPRRPALNVSGGAPTATEVTVTGVAYTVGAGGGADYNPNVLGNQRADFGFNPGTSAGNGCFFFNPFASAVSVSLLNGETPVASNTDVGFVSASTGGYGGVTGNYQGYAPGLGLQNSPGLVRWLYHNRENRTAVDNIFIDTVVNGVVDNYQLPGGDIAWAFGAQYRFSHRSAMTDSINNPEANPCTFLSVESEDLTAANNIVNATSTCAAIATPFTPTSGPRTPGYRQSVSHALLAELVLPFADKLKGDLKWRYEETRVPGSTLFIGSSVFGGSLKYDINDNFAIAADVNETFDAPNVGDDSVTTIRALDNPTTAAIFTGTTNNAINPGTLGTTYTNTELPPETGLNYTVSAIFQTRDRRASARVDFYHIAVTGQGVTATTSTIGRALTGNLVFGSNPATDVPIDCTSAAAQAFFNPSFSPSRLDGNAFVSYVDSAGNPVQVSGPGVVNGCIPGTQLRGVDLHSTPVDSDSDGNFFNDADDLGLWIHTVDRIPGGTTITSGFDVSGSYTFQQVWGGALSINADTSWELTHQNAEGKIFGIVVTQSANNIGLLTAGFAQQANIWRGSLGATYVKGRHTFSVRGSYQGAVGDLSTGGASTATAPQIPSNVSYNLNPQDTSLCNNPVGNGLPIPFLPMPVSTITGPTNASGAPIFTQPDNTSVRDSSAILTGEGLFSNNCILPEPQGVKGTYNFTMSATYRVRLPRETEMSFTVDNLLDEDPPLQRNGSGYNAFGSATPLGRQFKINLSKKFR